MKKYILLLASCFSLSACLHAQPAFQGYNDDFCLQEPQELNVYGCPDSGNLYVGVNGGANFVQDIKQHGLKAKVDVGYFVSADVGYRLYSNFRAEFEFCYRRNNIDRASNSSGSYHPHAHYKNFSYMANVVYDLDCWAGCAVALKPYVGAGIGYDRERLHIKIPNSSEKRTKNGFAWQLIAGAAYPVAHNVDLSLDFKFHKGRSHDVYNYSLGLGLNYHFGL